MVEEEPEKFPTIHYLETESVSCSVEYSGHRFTVDVIPTSELDLKISQPLF